MGILTQFIHKDMQVDHPKIKRALEREEEWFAYLLTLTDKKLEHKIHIINLQLTMALEQKKYVELDSLYLFKMLIIEARVRKMERGDIEEDDKPKRGKKPKAEKKTKITHAVEEDIQTTEKENEEQLKSFTPKQLSLFNFDIE